MTPDEWHELADLTDELADRIADADPPVKDALIGIAGRLRVNATFGAKPHIEQVYLPGDKPRRDDDPIPENS